MDKAKIYSKGNSQFIKIPQKYLSSQEFLIQEHKLGILIVDPEKRLIALKELMGSMKGDFFPDGYTDDSVWEERDQIFKE